MIHPKTLLTIAAIATFPAFIIFSRDALSTHKDRAFIEIQSKASGFWEQQANSTWTLSKYSETQNLQLGINQSYPVNYSLTVGKTSAGQTESKGTKGEVCITNSGDKPTENLTIVNQIQYKSREDFKNLAGANLTTNNTQVAAGKKNCIPFKITFTAPQGATQFRVHSSASITNFFKKEENEKSRAETASFILPTSPVTNQDTATVTDTIVCPEGFICTPSDIGPWTTTDAKVINYSVLIKNTANNCTTPVSLSNTATLTENATQNASSTTNVIPINTGGC